MLSVSCCSTLSSWLRRREDASLTSRRLGVFHHVVRLRTSCARNNFPERVIHGDLPLSVVGNNDNKYVSIQEAGNAEESAE